MELTTHEKQFLLAYEHADSNTKIAIDKLLDITNLKDTKFGAFNPNFVAPPYPVMKDVQFWITAIDDSFKADGIEKGDLLGCFMPEEICDEPKHIQIIAMPGEPMYVLGKIDFMTDFEKPGAMLYLNSEFTDKIFVSEEDLYSTVQSIGIVKLVIKCKEY